MSRRTFQPEAFITAVDATAEGLKIPRGALLHRIGASDSAPYGWKNGVSKPTVKHCIGLALEEGESAGRDAQVRLAKKWLDLAGRDHSGWNDAEIANQLQAFQERVSSRAEVIFENYIRELRRRVKDDLLKPRFVDATIACWEAQQSVHAHIDEWLKGSSARAVIHVHEWDDRLSPIWLEQGDLVRDYVWLLRQGAHGRESKQAKLLIFLCILLPRDNAFAQKSKILMVDALAELHNHLVAEDVGNDELKRFGLWWMRFPKRAEQIGDLWMYESGATKRESFGALIRSPAELVNVFGQVNGEAGEFDDIKAQVLANPIELTPEETERHLAAREFWRNRDQELKIKQETEQLQGAELRAYKHWRVLAGDDDDLMSDAAAATSPASGWQRLDWDKDILKRGARSGGRT